MIWNTDILKKLQNCDKKNQPQVEVRFSKETELEVVENNQARTGNIKPTNARNDECDIFRMFTHLPTLPYSGLRQDTGIVKLVFLQLSLVFGQSSPGSTFNKTSMEPQILKLF